MHKSELIDAETDGLNGALGGQGAFTSPSVDDLPITSPPAAAYGRAILPDLDKLPLVTRLWAGLLVGASSVVVALTLIWALVAAATLGSARPETFGLCVGYILRFVPELLKNADSWIALFIVIGVSVFGMLKPRTRPPMAMALSLWGILSVALMALMLAALARQNLDGSRLVVTLGVGAVLYLFHGACIATIFFLVYRKAQALLVGKSARTKDPEPHPHTSPLTDE